MKPLDIIKRIPFLQIGSPPDNFLLRRAKEDAEKRTKVKTFQMWDIQKVERRLLLRSFSEFKTVYVSIADLGDKKNNRNLIPISSPAITEFPFDKKRIEKFAGSPQFSFGGYYYTDKLFLMEDIFEWSYCRILWREIRRAKDIIGES